MFLDLSGLRSPSFPDGASRSYEWTTAPPTNASAQGPLGTLAGRAVLVAGQQKTTLSGSLLTSVQLTPTDATLIVRVPSPVPGYKGVRYLELTFTQSKAEPLWTVSMKGGGWLKHPDVVAGGLGDWLQQLGRSNLRVDFVHNDGFPLDLLGLADPFGWSQSANDTHHVRVGILSSAARISDTLLVMPSAESGRNNDAMGLKVWGLEHESMGHDAAWIAAPVLLGLNLSEPGPIWRMVAPWAPVEPLGKALKPSKRLQAASVLELLWNRPVEHALAGMRMMQAAQPLVSLPRLSLPAGGQKLAPMLVLDQVATALDPQAVRTRVRHVHLSSKDGFDLRADFAWQTDATAYGPWASQPWGTHASQLTFTGRVSPSVAVPWSVLPTDGEPNKWTDLWNHATGPLVADDQKEWLLRLPAKGAVTSLTPDRLQWLVWGSLEFGLLGEVEAELLCTVRGDWTKTRTDAYPESELIFGECLVRISAGTDSAGQDLRAAFGSLDEEEDRLQRDSPPLRFPKDVSKDEGRMCRVRIVHRSYPGRNAVTRVEVFSRNTSPLGTESVVLQMRPFFVGMVQPADIQAEAGTLIATWASDDAEGPQWRVPDATVTITFQPQAVGESMDRGARFWPAGKAGPLIDPSRVLPYRFSPPTQLVVRPSVQERRYNISPGNLGAVLRHAKVESFITEMVYPVAARFKVSPQGLPDVRVSETAAFLGWPSENLEPLPELITLPVNGPDEKRDDPLARWMSLAYSADAAAYANSVRHAIYPALQRLRLAQVAARANFAARLAQFEVYDPWSPNRALALSEGVAFRIRGIADGAPALSNPLPQYAITPGQTPAPQGTDLSPTQLGEVKQFLDPDTQGWGTGASSIPAGVVHTMEFASELVAVLREPQAVRGRIDALAFSALGASGQMSASFDEGRTTFIAQTSFGQVSRLMKVRIGRIGVLWNKARHVIVYERSVAASVQFAGEQEAGDAAPGKAKSTRGWPILRKTEEYVEPIEVVRSFGEEQSKDDNRNAFIAASEFVSQRIYVNGAWGCDLGHGYEIPLWNSNDRSGYYPKPQLALQARSAGADTSRCWFTEPDQLVFYSNTERGTGDDPDRWQAREGVDCPAALARLPLVAQNKSGSEVLGAEHLAAPRPGGTRRPRFDLAISSDGKVDLQHGRGETQMLVALDQVSLARTVAHAEAALNDPVVHDLFEKAKEAANRASTVTAAGELQSRANALITRAVERLLVATKNECKELKAKLKADIERLFDDATGQLNDALASLPPVALPSHAMRPLATSISKLEKELLDRERVLRAAFGRLPRELDAWSRLANQQGDQVRDKVKEQFASARELVAAALAAQRQSLAQQAALLNKTASDTPLKEEAIELSEKIKLLVGALTDLKAENAQAAAEACARVHHQLQKLATHSLLGAIALETLRAIQVLEHFLVDADAAMLQAWTQVQVSAKAFLVVLADIAALGEQFSDAVETATAGALKAYNELATEIDAQLTEVAKSLEQAPLAVGLAQARRLVQKIHDFVAFEAGQVEVDMVVVWRRAVADASGALRTAAKPVDDKLEAALQQGLRIATEVAKALTFASAGVQNWLTEIRQDALNLVDAIDCEAVDKLPIQQMALGLRNALIQAEADIRRRVTDSVSGLLDEATRAQLGQLEAAAAKVPELANQAGQALKLVKALGELPELPTLTFNADRAEYLFEDLEKQITTSPFAAKLREIDGGLKQLGIAIPAHKLLDQVIPDELKNIDFNKVFRNFGAIDFQDLMKNFKLPNMRSDQVKITQGVDKASRSAWVITKVNADFAERQSLFEFAGLAVTLAKMQLRAESDMRMSLNGDRSSSTDALLRADWGLQYGGANLAVFREVAIRFDGSRFDFDIEPSKVELHPALKFVDEFVKRFRPELPPAVQIEKDSRGVPVGASASMVTDVKLPPLGAVEIGPLKIASGLAMRMRNTGQFEITAHLEVGSKTAPVWVQIGYLGGGMWLEAKARYLGSVSYTASVGLAIGCVRAISIASVANGSFSLLLFAYAEMSESGGSLRIGFSVQGSARIIGIANASLYLLLEAEHKGGRVEGRGTLDVKVDICWCYTLHVRRDVNHKIG